ncbi:hypothetical protein BT63DRAFT_5486 [Microthyrium microscopicum]|uniref:Large ribosomal subunit protein bL21m n=1 Tax=Microthyrium microscopicum TaxID=703497 RepID=A0A6A6UPQ3_9PEZI|nr:hypothetical protein BT63DRAFT_5486 [Microthyrium microscopicum]
MFSRTIRKSLIGTRWAPVKTSTQSQRQAAAALATQSTPPASETNPKPFIKATTRPGSSPSHPRDIAKAKPQDRAQILPSYEDLRTQTFEPRAPAEPTTSTDAVIDSSVKQLLPHLRSQPPFFTTIHIHGRPYLVTVGDVIRLPFLMPGVEQGDLLRLNRASLIGSRDYTLKAGATKKGETPKYLDERLFTCRARVTGETQEPLRIKEKTKRRRRHVKHTKSRHKYTVLTVTELEIADAESIADLKELPLPSTLDPATRLQSLQA